MGTISNALEKSLQNKEDEQLVINTYESKKKLIFHEKKSQKNTDLALRLFNNTANSMKVSNSARSFPEEYFIDQAVK